MYHYEQVLHEHRQRVARGAQNYDRRRVAAERAAEQVVGESNSHEREVMDEGVSSETEAVSESNPRFEATSSVR